MKHKFSSFLTHKGRWFLTTLTLLFTFAIGQMWGDVVSKNTSTTGTIIYSNINSGTGNVSISAGNEENGFAAVGSAVSFKKGPDCISVPADGYFMVCVDDITSGTVSITMAGTGTPKVPDWSSTSGGSDDRYFQLYVDDTAKKKFLYSKYSASAVLAEPDVTGLTYENSKIRGLRQFDFTASDLTTVSTKKYLKFKALGGEMKPYGIKIVQAATPSASPTIGTHPSTSAAQYIKDATATALSVSASGSGTLTYQWYSNTTASNTSGSAIDGATSASYTPSTAAVGTLYYYCAVTNTESGKSATTVKSNVSGAITVTYPATGTATITYNLDVTDSGTTLQTLNTTNATSSSISVSASTDLLAGGLTKSSSKGTHNGTRTLGINTLAEETADKYFNVTFTVAGGCQFTPSAISLKTLTIGGNATSYKAVLTDGVGSIVGTVNATNDSEVTLGSWTGLGTTSLTGTVTLKLYAWYTTSGSYNAYRLSTPITITGTVTATTPAAPEFTEPATEPAAATYYIGKTITALSVAATGYPVPTLQWYSNDSKSTTGATPIDGATSATYTPSNAAASDLYYYCVATNASGTDRSEYFHVTVVPAPTIEDLVTISDDYTKTFTETITEGSIYDSNRFLNCGGAENNYSSGKGIRIKENRALAFKVADNAKVKATFEQNGDRKMQLGTSRTGDNKTAYGNSASSPVTFDVVSTGGVIYLTASSDLNLSKIEIFYPHTVTYALNGGTGTLPTQASKYAGEKFTVHDGETGISAPATKEFDKWKDQDNADVAGGAEYTMPAKAVTLTAQWRAETVKYTVTYDLADYTAGVAPTETNKAEGDVFAIKAAPERESYDFLGWLCDIDAATYQATNNYTMTAANTTFTAQWQEFFTITYKDGSTTLDTEKVNVGDAPAGIANPTKELYNFVGWTLEGEDDLIDPTTLTATTTLFAKWTAFDGCAYLAPETSGAEPSANDAVLLKSSSFGGTAKVVGKNGSGSITYTENGLSFSGGGKDSIRVTLNNQMQVGTTISVRLVAHGTNARGLKLSTLSGTEKATLGFGSGTQTGDVGTFSYTVTADDGLDGKKAFRLSRSNSIYLKYITVEDCAPQDFTVTYKDGSTTTGTESVFENAHPTATGIATRKNGYVFQGWSETNGGDLVDLDDITITADKILYAKYTERVCATSGSMFKFQMKTDLTNGNVFANTPNSVAATTDNYLAELAGGDVTFAVTGSSNNNLLFYDQKSIGFANGSQGRITINLDCPLAANDVIRFVNYAASGQKARLSDGSHNLDLDGNGAETVQQIAVPADFVGAYELTITRANNTPKITSFEIYRRPALTGVTMDDMRLKIGKTGTPVLHLTPSDDAIVTSQAWEITASTATGTTINAETGLITAGTTTGEMTVQVTLNGDKVASATVAIVQGFEAVVPVTATTTWDWTPVSTTSNGPTISAPDTVLANYISGAGWENLAGNVGAYVYRSTDYKAFQGTKLSFKAAVPGKLKIYAGRTSSDKKVYVNGIEVGTVTSSKAYLNEIVVPAGDVVITSESMRIYNMTFDTNLVPAQAEESFLQGYERTVDPQYYGTICLPKAGVMTGALLFRVSYMDYKEDGYTPYKVYYDQVANGTMEAGMPYIFLAEQSTIGVYYTGTATETAQHHNGLYGTLEDITSGMNAEGRYMIYYNQVLHSTHSASQLPANRAYLQIEEIPGYGNPSYVAPAPKYRRISMGVNAPQIATGMDELNVTDAPRKIMIDGTMYILRGEKMYDATGRLVK